MINKTCHATRAYLVVDGETQVAAANELRDAASVPRKQERNQLPRLFGACYIERQATKT